MRILSSRAKIALLVGVAVATLALAGCDPTSKAAQPFNDAPVVGKVDNSGARVVAMPDGFNNAAIHCFAGTHSGLVSTFHGDSPYGSVAVFQNAEICP